MSMLHCVYEVILAGWPAQTALGRMCVERGSTKLHVIKVNNVTHDHTASKLPAL